MGKTAVVTGASHNIGQGIAIVLAEQGYDLAITYMSRPEGAEITKQKVEALGRKCFVYQADLGIAEKPQEIMDKAHKDLGHIDLLVCNAARPGFTCSILTTIPEHLDAMYASNYRNYVMCAAAASRYMVADKIAGNIVFITSSRAEMSYVDDFIYGGFKAGIKRATESIALDLSAYNIRVNCVAPGATWPDEMMTEERANSPFIKESIPLHRVGTPRDMGEAVAFIASEKASYITGTTIRLDGGLILPGMLEGYDKIPWVREGWREKVYEQAMQMVEDHNKEI